MLMPLVIPPKQAASTFPAPSCIRSRSPSAFFAPGSLTSLALSGNGGWTGLIYAPYADMNAGGGGNTIQDVIGAIVVKNITLKGHWNFHYDESLKVNGPLY